jgi:transposase
VDRVWERYQQSGSRTVLQIGGYRAPRLEKHEALLRQWVEREPGLTLEQLCQRYLKEQGKRWPPRSYTANSGAWGCASKKTLHASEQTRSDVARHRRLWRRWQKRCDPRRLVFLDETGLNTKMVRLYGRSQDGSRCVDRQIFGHWNTSTFIAALRADRVEAPLILDGVMNADCFLAPTLKPGDVVICDNLSSHKSPGVGKAIEAVGARILFLPPYSPDLNPIEMLFSRLKNTLRKQAARTVAVLSDAVRSSIDSMPASYCSALFHHAGYESN